MQDHDAKSDERPGTTGAGQQPVAFPERIAEPPSPPGKVLVAMSGGVDSALTAATLLDAGWDVAGVTFKLFCYGEGEGTRRACCGLEGVRDAQAAARRLDIPHVVLDMQDLFREKVLDDFVSEYGRGRTPNPCVLCNTFVKFGPLLSWARRTGHEWIATGHYARAASVSHRGEERCLTGRALDDDKDQSYVLWGVRGEVLERTLMPLGSWSKSEVRNRARELGLPVWDKEESQDICFVDSRGYTAVVRERLGEDHPAFRSGEIRDERNAILGRHDGLVNYTVGQRRGLGLGGPELYRVLRLEMETNTLRVGRVESLDSGGLWASDLNLAAPTSWIEGPGVEVKIRYRHAAVDAIARLEEGRLHIRFRQPQSAVAPGQSCVVYRGGWVVAGGRIEGPCDCCAPPGGPSAFQRNRAAPADP